MIASSAGERAFRLLVCCLIERCQGSSFMRHDTKQSSDKMISKESRMANKIRSISRAVRVGGLVRLSGQME